MTHFVGVVREEVARWHARSPSRLTWSDLQDLFDRLTLRVVFGDTAADDRPLLNALDTLDGARQPRAVPAALGVRRLRPSTAAFAATWTPPTRRA